MYEVLDYFSLIVPFPTQYTANRIGRPLLPHFMHFIQFQMIQQ